MLDRIAIDERVKNRSKAAREVAHLLKCQNLLKDIDYCADKCIDQCLKLKLKAFRETYTNVFIGFRFRFPSFQKYSLREVYNRALLQVKIEGDQVVFTALIQHFGVNAYEPPVYTCEDRIGHYDLKSGQMYYTNYVWWK